MDNIRRSGVQARLGFGSLTIHQRTILLLQRDYPGTQTKNFRRSIQRLQWDWDDWETAESQSGEKRTWKDFLEAAGPWAGGILPDLWFIDEECMSVICIEVEDTHPINTDKLDQYVSLWWHLDEMYWETHLLCSDRWGNLTPVPLTDFTEMGLSEIQGNPIGPIIEAELDAKKVTFELTKIYAIRDPAKRSAARQQWLANNEGFGLRTNPKFYKRNFLKRRGLAE